jgi:hypothetical protein
MPEFDHICADFRTLRFEMNESGRRSLPGPLASSRLAAHKLVFLGSPAARLAPQSHQELTVACGKGFLGKAKNNR